MIIQTSQIKNKVKKDIKYFEAQKIFEPNTNKWIESKIYLKKDNNEQKLIKFPHVK